MWKGVSLDTRGHDRMVTVVEELEENIFKNNEEEGPKMPYISQLISLSFDLPRPWGGSEPAGIWDGPPGIMRASASVGRNPVRSGR